MAFAILSPTPILEPTLKMDSFYYGPSMTDLAQETLLGMSWPSGADEHPSDLEFFDGKTQPKVFRRRIRVLIRSGHCFQN